MDRIVLLIVKLMVLLSRLPMFTRQARPSELKPGDSLKLLLVGYNGARNTGADARVAALVEQLRRRFGTERVKLTVMTLDRSSTDRYFPEDVESIEFTTMFFFPLLKQCSRHHAAVLCEGSTLKSMFANALTLYHCQAAGIMAAQGKPCVAYGSEVGDMDPFVERAARSLCRDVVFVPRTANSLDRVRDMGLPGSLGTDTAWTFDASSGAEDARKLLVEGGWDGKRPLVGVAAINPFCWPVRPSVGRLIRSLVTGDDSDRYNAWYFFSTSNERTLAFEAYLDGLAHAVDIYCTRHDCQPVVIGMEQLDAKACAGMVDRLGGSVPVAVSKDCDAFLLGSLLESLSLLVTSRYHAHVLSTKANVPVVAVTMDERLANLADELGTEDMLLRVDDPDLGPELLKTMEAANAQRDRLALATMEYRQWAIGKLSDMEDVLENVLQTCYPAWGGATVASAPEGA